jgi:hypothetical protein
VISQVGFGHFFKDKVKGFLSFHGASRGNFHLKFQISNSKEKNDDHDLSGVKIYILHNTG